MTSKSISSSDEIVNHFNNASNKFMTDFEKKGLKKHTSIIIDFFEGKDLSSYNVLELGCGVGGLLLKFLDMGANHVLGIDLSELMIEKAKLLAESRNYHNKNTYLAGDFNSGIEGLPLNQVDIAIADRVFCCSPVSMDILKNMLKFAPQYIVIILPRRNWILRKFWRLKVRLGNLRRGVKKSIKTYYYHVNQIDQVCASFDYKRVLQRFRYSWELLIYEKDS